MYGGGKYLLSQPFKRFAVKGSVWHSWSEERRRDHIEKLRMYVPTISDTFSKPDNAGRKPGYQQRSRHTTEPDVVVDRCETVTNTMRVSFNGSPNVKHWVKSSSSAAKDNSLPKLCSYLKP